MVSQRESLPWRVHYHGDDNWLSDILISNEGIEQTMPKNRFQEISQFLHLNDTSQKPARGEANFGRFYKCHLALTNKCSEKCLVLLLAHKKKKHFVNEEMIVFTG